MVNPQGTVLLGDNVQFAYKGVMMDRLGWVHIDGKDTFGGLEFTYDLLEGLFARLLPLLGRAYKFLRKKYSNRNLSSQGCDYFTSYEPGI